MKYRLQKILKERLKMIRGFFIGLFGIGFIGGALIILGIVALFSVSATTCALFIDLFKELEFPLEFQGMKYLIVFLIVAIVLIILSELGPVSRFVGKAFIISQIGFAITGIVMLFSDKVHAPFLIGSSIIAIIIAICKSEGLWDFLLEHPILSILSAIPASFFIFDYIWLMKEELNPRGSMIVFAKESLIISLIIFGIFTAFEIFVLIKNKS